MVLERLEAWTQNPVNQPKTTPGHPLPTTRLPTSVLFYRDGVSESQFQECMDHEVKAIKDAFRRLATNHGQPNAQLRLTFVVVGKRHHTRFYPKEAKESFGGFAGKPRQGNWPAQPGKPINGNVRPGLLVEDVVTTPHAYNFYLQSHAAPAGTARSAHYHVLLDDMSFGSDNQRLATITNTLCYCFPRALKGVSYAAPAYIADRMCERGRVWLRHWKPDQNFKLPATNNGVSWDPAAVTRWKAAKALELSRTTLLTGPNMEKVWVHYNDNAALGPVRFNPWHSNLDDTMFWM